MFFILNKIIMKIISMSLMRTKLVLNYSKKTKFLKTNFVDR